MKLAQGVLWLRTTGVVLVVLCIWQLSSFPVSAMESTSLADVIERVKPVVVNISVGGGNAAPAVAHPERFLTAISHLKTFFVSFSVGSHLFRLRMTDRAREQWVQALLLIHQGWL